MEQTTGHDITTRYHALREGVGYAPLDRGIIRLTGADRIDLLHRLSTADLARLQPGQVATTIVTSEKGRIVDLLEVVVVPGGHSARTCACRRSSSSARSRTSRTTTS